MILPEHRLYRCTKGHVIETTASSILYGVGNAGVIQESPIVSFIEINGMTDDVNGKYCIKCLQQVIGKLERIE